MTSSFTKHVHAPLAQAVPGLRRCVLSPVSAQSGRPDMPAHGIAIDGIAELWYGDAGMAARGTQRPPGRRNRCD